MVKHETWRGAGATLRMAALAGLFCSSLLVPICASAALGGDVASVETDQQQMKATRAVQSNENYSVHVITTPYGTVVREYVSPNGQVFGVAWRGPFLPNFRQLLGNYYGKVCASRTRGQCRAARPLTQHAAACATTGPVMFSAGHMRAYAGRAFDPGMIPPGVDAQEIR